MSVQIEKWAFTVDEYDRLSEAGILSEDERVELIEGEIIRMSPIGRLHASAVDRLNAILNRKAGQITIVRVQNPIRLDDYTEPQPDIVLFKPRDDFYSREHPTAESVLLLIEVCDTSLEYDRNVKLPIYAKAGIPEVWLEDLTGDRIESYSHPANGIFKEVRISQRGESISPKMLPDFLFTVDEILG